MSWFRRKPKPPPGVLYCFYRWLEFCRRYELMTVEESNQMISRFQPLMMEDLVSSAEYHAEHDIARNARLD